MYIIGNAEQLASASKMWRTVINDLAADNAVGPGFPISCHRHKEVVYVDQPGRLALVSPDGESNYATAILIIGGCNPPCDGQLGQCGHRCRRKVSTFYETTLDPTADNLQCHADDAFTLGVGTRASFVALTIAGTARYYMRTLCFPAATLQMFSGV
jgi:hypothetical protein